MRPAVYAATHPFIYSDSTCYDFVTSAVLTSPIKGRRFFKVWKGTVSRLLYLYFWLWQSNYYSYL